MRTAKGHLGSVTFDGQTVTVTKQVRGEVQLPVTAIQSVSIQRAGLGMRGIRFAVAGGTLARSSVALGSHRDLAKDPYALTFRKGRLEEFQALAAEVNSAIAQR